MIRFDRGLLACSFVAVVACRTAGATMQAEAPSNPLRTGIELYEAGKFVEAEAQLRRAAGVDADAYLAASLAKQKKYEEAEPPAKSALESEPTHVVAVAALGEALVGQKKYDEAIERLGDAIKAKDDLAYAFFWRGQAYYAKKKPDRMVEDFEAFLRLAPKAPEAATVRQLLENLR